MLLLFLEVFVFNAIVYSFLGVFITVCFNNECVDVLSMMMDSYFMFD